MFIPDFNVISFFQLYSNEPCKAQINHHVDNNIFNITIFKKDGDIYDTRDINLDDTDYTFFDTPIDTKYYYQIICLASNSYDALEEHQLDIFFDIDKAISLSEEYSHSNSQKYNSPEFIVSVKKVIA